MNYGLALSLKLEEQLAELEAQGVTDDVLGESLEDRAMSLAAEELFRESDFKHKPWAYNGKALRMGEIILIIDADTIVPEVRCWPIRSARTILMNACRIVSGMLRGRCTNLLI